MNEQIANLAKKGDLPHGWWVMGHKYELKEVWEGEDAAWDVEQDYKNQGWTTKVKRGKNNLYGVYAR